MSFLDILALIMPAFGLIGVGFAAGYARLLPDSVGEALATFVFTVPLPLLLMRSVATATVPETSPWPFWLTYFAGVVVSWSVGQLIIRRVFGQDAGVALIGGLVAGFSNLVLLGIPITYTTYGEAGMVPLLLLISIHFPVMVTVATILFERMASADSGERGHTLALLKRIGVSLVKNPLMIGIAIGFFMRFSHVEVGGVPKAIIDQLADCGSPLALFALGLGLKRYGIRGNLAGGLTVAMCKLVLLPAVVWVVARLVGLPPLWVAAASVFMFSTRFGVGHGLASNGITLSTLIGVVTMTGWIAFVAGSF